MRGGPCKKRLLTVNPVNPLGFSVPSFRKFKQECLVFSPKNLTFVT